MKKILNYIKKHIKGFILFMSSIKFISCFVLANFTFEFSLIYFGLSEYNFKDLKDFFVLLNLFFPPLIFCFIANILIKIFGWKKKTFWEEE